MQCHVQMQCHVANCAIGPTTLRNMFDQVGWRPKIRKFLGEIDLAELKNNGTLKSLNKWTDTLKSQVGVWGPSRKAINLFLRDAAYNFLLRDRYGLHLIEPDLELPLDGVVMAKLHKNSSSLPRPPSVKTLTYAVSDQYQLAASKLAASKGISRVHLDISLWDGGSKI
jgi:hypothetical protein